MHGNGTHLFVDGGHDNWNTRTDLYRSCNAPIPLTINGKQYLPPNLLFPDHLPLLDHSFPPLMICPHTYCPVCLCLSVSTCSGSHGSMVSEAFSHLPSYNFLCKPFCFGFYVSHNLVIPLPPAWFIQWEVKKMNEELYHINGKKTSPKLIIEWRDMARFLIQG